MSAGKPRSWRKLTGGDFHGGRAKKSSGCPLTALILLPLLPVLVVLSFRTDGDWKEGGRGHCRRWTVAALPLMPVLLPVLYILSFFGRRQDEPEHGHPVGHRHKQPAPKGGTWWPRRAAADDDPDLDQPPPRGGKPRTNEED